MGHSLVLQGRQRWLETPVFWALQKCSLKKCWWLPWFPAAQHRVFFGWALSSPFRSHQGLSTNSLVLSPGHEGSSKGQCVLSLFCWRDPPEVIGIAMRVVLHFVIPLLEIRLSMLGICLRACRGCASSFKPLVLLQHTLVYEWTKFLSYESNFMLI